ncbi:MAG TPA: hypothetical protein VNC82_01840 [Candidatus Limnocylindria bacterium]|nr:hypothetical protein [Candidatus Limnocylindria bacterium]
MAQPHRRGPWWAGWRIGLALAGVLALPAAAAPDGVTYSRDIAPLLAASCQSCHRDGEIAPFPLTSYDDAYRRRHKLVRTVERRKMPPWPPVPGHGDFVGERRLADADIARLRAWLEAGAPEGDPRDLPPPRAFPALWSAGAPDVVLAPGAAFDVPTADRDLYRCFVIPTAFAEDRFVSVAEFLPGDRRIVHHVIGYVDTSGQAEALDRAIYIDAWDFHWQGSYTFRTPVPLPGGSRIDVEAVYDNSSRNRRNPTVPPRDVGWGQGTADEMCIAFVRTTVDSERLAHQPAYTGPLARQP